MKIAVTTPTGHVGSAVANFLLDIGNDVQVKLLGRRPERLTALIRRGAEMAIGSQDNADYLTNATEDVDALFWATPPGYGSDNVRAFQNRLAKAACQAVRASGIKRVVNLSSIGAQLDSGVGPINGLHDVEGLFNQTQADITHLRPGFFFENLLWQLDAIKERGSITLPLSGTKRYPMIAARDIGRVAAGLLASEDWSGQCVRELHGAADISFDEVAKTLSDVLGRRIAFVQCTAEQDRKAMLDSGMSDDAADMMLELYDAVNCGLFVTTQPRSAQTTTPTTLADFAHEVLAPLLPETVGGN